MQSATRRTQPPESPLRFMRVQCRCDEPHDRTGCRFGLVHAGFRRGTPGLRGVQPVSDLSASQGRRVSGGTTPAPRAMWAVAHARADRALPGTQRDSTGGRVGIIVHRRVIRLSTPSRTGASGRRSTSTTAAGGTCSEVWPGHGSSRIERCCATGELSTTWSLPGSGGARTRPPARGGAVP